MVLRNRGGGEQESVQPGCLAGWKNDQVVYAGIESTKRRNADECSARPDIHFSGEDGDLSAVVPTSKLSCEDLPEAPPSVRTVSVVVGSESVRVLAESSIRLIAPWEVLPALTVTLPAMEPVPPRMCRR